MNEMILVEGLRRVRARLFAMAIALTGAMALFAFGEEGNVTSKARMEVERRAALSKDGAFVEIVDDQIRDEATATTLEMFGVPANDNHKFFLTILTPADFGCPACEKLKADLGKAAELSKWVDLSDHERSFMHVNFYAHSKADPKKANPFKPGMWDRIDVKGYPTILIQAPRSGKYGKAGAVVNQLTGYKGPAAFDEWIRKSLEEYGAAVSGKNAPRTGRVDAASDSLYGQAPAPFPLPPKELPTGPDRPVVYDELVKTTPKELSLTDIKKAVPEAPLEFIVEQLEKKVSDPQQVAIAWMMAQLKKRIDEKPEPAPTPPAVKVERVEVPKYIPTEVVKEVIPGWIFAALTGSPLAGALLLALLQYALRRWNAYAKSTPSPDDDKLANAMTILAQALTGKPIDVAQ